MIHRTAYSNPTFHSFEACLADCLDVIQQQTNKNTLLAVIFFIDTENINQYQSERRSITEAMSRQGLNIPFNVLAQADSCPISMEIWTDSSARSVEHLSCEGIRYTRVLGDTGKSIFGMGLSSADAKAGIMEQAEETFRILVHILRQEDLTLSDIIRQWNYVPGILQLVRQQGKTVQHYQLFNEVRKKWYSDASFADGYPAATGIGVKTGPFSIDFIAQSSTNSLKKTGLINPNQVNAYQYSQQKLVGDALNEKVKHPPLFERAKLVESNNESLIFVSGTASILGQETVGIGDVGKQTEVTIANMQELIDPGVTRKEQPFQFNYMRVYIKDNAHRESVKEICDLQFPQITKLYVQADVCRDNLLMEIEGEAT